MTLDTKVKVNKSYYAVFNVSANTCDGPSIDLILVLFSSKYQFKILVDI